MSIKKICSHPGCTRYAEDGSRFCERHHPEPKPFTGGSWLSDYRKVFYQSSRWKKERKEFLESNPHCEICGSKATDIHHQWPDNYDYWNSEDFFDRSHWVGLCSSCHDRISRQAMARRRHGGHS